jgi:glyoxylase-like metal-dependent hydrolase (beta-lactamase superfamily II)
MSWQIGAARITKVPQMSWHIPLWSMVPDATEAACHEVAPGLVGPGARAEISVHGFVIEAGGRRVLIDTCIGHDDHADQVLSLIASVGTIEHHHTDIRTAVEAAGWSADDIDVVVCTHLHFDHIGGTWAAGGPSSPSARYVVAGDEWDHWSTTAAGSDRSAVDQRVQPLVTDGRVDLVDADHAIGDGIRLVPTPGHTPGHVSVEIASRDAVGVITGDLAHHPIELLAPDWAMVADVDPERCSVSRRAFVDRYGDGETLVFGTHFGGTSVGRLTASAASWSGCKPQDGATEP